MKWKNIILVSLLFLSKLCISQIDSISNGSVIDVNGQPYVLFDSTTVNAIVNSIVSYDECREVRDTLKSIIFIQEDRLALKDSVIEGVRKESKIKDEFVVAYGYKIQNQKNYIDTLTSESKKTKTKNTIITTLGGILVVGLITGLVLK